jgi:hypothetical protein
MLSPAEVASAAVEGVQRNKKGVYIPSNLDWSVRIGKYETCCFFPLYQFFQNGLLIAEGGRKAVVKLYNHC